MKFWMWRVREEDMLNVSATKPALELGPCQHPACCPPEWRGKTMIRFCRMGAKAFLALTQAKMPAAGAKPICIEIKRVAKSVVVPKKAKEAKR